MQSHSCTDHTASKIKILELKVFRPPPQLKEDEVDGGVLEDVANLFEDTLQSPAKVAAPEDSEGSSELMKLIQTRESQEKMKKTLHPKDVGECSKQKLDTVESSFVVSPVFKKTKHDQGVPSKVENMYKHRKNCECCPVSQLIVR